MSDLKRLAEIKAITKAGQRGERHAWVRVAERCHLDVPFLLAKLEEAERKLATAETAADGFENMHHEALRREEALSAAAGQMRAALETLGGRDVDRCADCGQLGFNDRTQRWHEEDCGIAAALATDAGKGWVSPGEAERLRVQIVAAKGAAKILGMAAEHRVSEEESDRRCREVQSLAVEFMVKTGRVPEGAELNAIVERVKGGTR